MNAAGDEERTMKIALRQLKHAFIVRLAEWAFAVILALSGVVLLMPVATFDSDDWVAFRPLMSEDALGWLLLVGGLARILVLAANGSWRPMYHLRAWMALSSGMVWFVITLGFLSSGKIGLWLAVYPALFAFDVVNMFRAIGDAAAVDAAARRMGEKGGERN